MKQKLVEERRFEGQEAQLISGKIIRISSTWYVVNDDIFMTSIQLNLFMFFLCNSMPFGAAWAYYGKVLVLASAAL